MAINEHLDRLMSIHTDLAEQNIRFSLRGATLRQSILRYAFEGKLVPQDPKDEPASQILDRIRNERQATQSVNHRSLARKRSAKDIL